jgi:hypothetical protein
MFMYKKTIVLGDFNLNSCNVNTINEFECLVSFCEFTQKNSVPNCDGCQLDLVLCSLSVEHSVSVREADEALVQVDKYHPPLVILVPLGGGACETALPTVTTSAYPTDVGLEDAGSQWNFYKADYNLLYSLLATIDWTPMYRVSDPEDILNYFYDTANDIINDCVPKKRRKGVYSKYSYPEWYTFDIIRNIKEKARLHKLYKRSGASCDYEMFARCRTVVKELIVVAHKQHQNRVQKNITNDPKSFWQFVRAEKATNHCKKITKNGNFLGDAECANEFARYFHSVYNSQRAKLDVEAAVEASGSTSGLSSARVHIGRLELSQVTKALARLKPKPSAGPDGIPAFIVRDCRAILAEPLLHIFNQCLETSYFPTRWKITRVIPVPKGEAGFEVSGYRPVAVRLSRLYD